MEGRTLVAEALLASAEGTEVLGGLWDIVEELKGDALDLGCISRLLAYVAHYLC